LNPSKGKGKVVTGLKKASCHKDVNVKGKVVRVLF